MHAAVVIFRLPAAAIITAHDEGRILQRRRQRELLRTFQCRVINQRLQRRADRPAGIQCAVESRIAAVASGDHRAQRTATPIRDHHRALHDAFAVETIQRFRHHQFGLALQNRINAGEHAQTAGGDLAHAVALTQFALRPVQHGRNFSAQRARRLHDAQRLLLPALGVFGRQLLHGNQPAQHMIAPRPCTVRMPPRRVIRRSADDTDQQRRFGQIQFGQRFAKVVACSQTDAVDRALTVLAEKDLVQIGFENFVLAVVPVQHQRHQAFTDFPPPAALVIEEIVFHQLLGQRRSALHGFPLTDIGPGGAQYRPETDAVMAVEVFVFSGDQGFHQRWRCIGQPHQFAIFIALRAVTAKQQGIQSRRFHRDTVFPQLLHAGALQGDFDFAFWRTEIAELKCTGNDQETITGLGKFTGLGRRFSGAIAQQLQFKTQIASRQRQAFTQHQGARIHGHRLGPALAFKMFFYFRLQIQQHSAQQQRRDQRQFPQPGPEALPHRSFACYRFFSRSRFFAASVLFVFARAFGHECAMPGTGFSRMRE